MLKNTLLLLLLCGMLLTATHSDAQSYILQHLGVEDGLSNNYVRDIVQDEQGFVWIATEAGLNRFDGCKFTTYRSNNSGLSHDAVNALLYDKTANKLWIGGYFKGIYTLDCSTYQFKNLGAEEGINISHAVHLTHASDCGIWIAAYHKNVLHYNTETHVFTSLKDRGIDIQQNIWCIFDDGEGNLYIGHAQGGMSIVNLKENTLQHFTPIAGDAHSLPGNSVYSIYKDHLENIWVGTNNGLGLFNPKTKQFNVFRHDNNNPYSLIADHIYCIKEMNDDTLWITSDIGGISILDLHSITFQSPENIKFYNIKPDNSENGISSGNIRDLLQDSFGNIWIGNFSSGIDFISHLPPTFRTLPYTIEKGNRFIYKPVSGICKDEDEQVWIGGKNEIALFRDNKLVKIIDISKQLTRPYGQVLSMISDGHGNLLLGIYDDGLLKYNTRSGNIERIRLDIPSMDILTLSKDTDGKIWIGAEYGIYSYQNGKVYKEEELYRQLPDKSIYSIVRDDQGKLWIGSSGAGVIVFDRNDKAIASLNMESGLCSNSINQICKDATGGIWIATRNGVGYIKDTKQPHLLECYNYKHGLADTFIRAIQEDQSGNIWLSTNNGISLWNKDKRTFENYDYRDGIPTGNFIEGSVCCTEDNTLYFGTLSGACYFNPKNILMQQQVASVQIIECKSLDNLIESRSEETIIPTSNAGISLPYDKNSFRISFTVPDYSQNAQVEYAYMIEGLENSWTNTSGENMVTFRNISPGEYTFKVKARLRNQEWDDTHIASLNIYIHPPLWLTWYAKTFYFLLIVFAVSVWFRFYKRKLMLESSLELEKKKSQNEQELNNERLRFYTNITHELRTPLTLILGPLEDLVNDANVPAFYGKKISVIHASALRLLNLINQILEFRKTETQNRKLTVAKADLSSLVTEIGLRYKELNRNEKVKFHIDIPTDNPLLYFDADILSTILNNLLSNAIKYTPEGDIKLSMHTIVEGEQSFTEITVSDTGYGIDAEALPHIFDRYYQAEGKHQASGTGIGLALVKSLTDLHEGTLRVESEAGQGTTFTLRLLTENTYPDALHKEVKSEPTKPENKKSEEDNEDSDLRPMILIVEDNDDIRDYIAASFSSGHRILMASNGKEGLENAKQYIPDIIISDIMMPVMDGIELCRQVKEDICTSHIPVILLTAKDSIQDKEEGYESGADSYLTKPFSAKLLHSRVNNLLESRKKLAQLITSRTNELKPEQAEPSLQLSRLDEEFLSRFSAIVEANVDKDKLDMSFMKDKMNMSHSTLYRKIKGLTGLSGNEFIRKIRLKNSMRLLTEAGCNVSEAAYASGFNDLGYFRTCFKEVYGMSPSEYLKQKR